MFVSVSENFIAIDLRTIRHALLDEVIDSID